MAEMTAAMAEADQRNVDRILDQTGLFAAYSDDEAPPAATPGKPAPDPLIDEALEALRDFPSVPVMPPAAVATARQIRRELGI